MKDFNVFIAGIGGQGSLLMGQVLAEAAIKEGLHTTWVPIYGVEKRGGDATVTIIISQEEVGSPLLAQVDNMVVMHQRMWDKYKDRIKENGLLIINSSIVDIKDGGYELIKVPATEIAISIGEDRAANMVLLGVLLKERPVVSIESVKEVIKEKSKSPKAAELNIKALMEGLSYE